MKQREFHLYDFPEDKIRILFGSQDEFIQRAINYFGSGKKLADYLKTVKSEIYNWGKYKLYLPLKAVKLIAEKLELNLYDLEKEIISYKGVNTSNQITNPKFPIKETPEMFSIITHIICDGSVNKNGIPIYTNSNKSLIDNLDRELKNTFGDFRENLYFGSGTYKNCYQYRFPKIFIKLIEHFYNINFYKKKEIPIIIFDLPKEYSIAVVRAFADDEGSIDFNKRISFTQKDKELLELLRRILKEKLGFDKLSEVGKKDENCYYFYIKSQNIEKYQNEIGFVHPKKAVILKNIVESKLVRFWTGQHGKAGETREKLLNLLNDRVLSTCDIAGELKINSSNIGVQIKKLIDEGLINIHHRTGQSVFWTKTKEN